MDVRLPDGTVIKNVPEGTSKSDLATKLKANGMNVPDSWGSTDFKPSPKSAFDGLMDTAKNVYGSFLEPAATMASGAIAKPLGDIAGLAAIPANAVGLTDKDPAAVQQGVQDALTYKPRTEAGTQAVSTLGKVADSTLGSAGRFAGNFYGTAANMVGASPGVQQAISNGANELTQQVPALLGAKLPEAGASRIAQAAQDTVNAAPRAAQVVQAQKAGYRLSPQEAGVDGPGSRTLPGIGGKAQTNDALSIYNQGVTDNLAKADLNVPANVPFDQAAIAKVKTNANAMYDQIKKADQNQIPVVSKNGMTTIGPDGQPLTKAAGPVITDPKYAADVKAIGADRANPDFGTTIDKDVQDLQAELTKEQFSTKGAVDKITTLRQDARTNLNATDDVAKKNLGRAQQQAADALEGQLDRYLQNQPGVLKGYQQARTTLAKAQTIGDAMSADGHVDAAHINNYRNNGGYVAGNLQTIADAADSFKRTVRNTQNVQAPSHFSAFDYTMHTAAAPFTAALGMGGHGAAAGAAAAVPALVTAGRAGARAVVNSGAYQRALGPTNTAAGALSQLAVNPASPLLGALANPDDLAGAQ